MSRQQELRVRHRFLGDGSVVRWMARRREAVVLFDYGKMMTVRSEDILPILDSGPLGQGVKLRAQDQVHIPEEYGQGDRYVIEAFRLGIVPNQGINQWTFGRDGELSYLSEWLADPEEASMYMFGDYGSGKTHLLGAMGQRALKEGWAVAVVPLDPMDSPPSSPKSVYRSILRSLRWFNPESGVEMDAMDLLRLSLERGLGQYAVGHRYLQPLVRVAGRKKQDSEIWQWFLGEQVDAAPLGVPPMLDHTTSSNVYVNLLGWMGWMGYKFAGLKGLLLLLDEAEMVTAVRWHKQLQRGLNFIVGLSRAAQLHQDLLQEEILRDEKTGLYSGARTGLTYSGHIRLRFLPEVPESLAGVRTLKLIFAVTPTELMRGLVEQHDFDAMDIEPLPMEALETLFMTFAAHFLEVYRMKMTRVDLDRIRQALINDFRQSRIQRRFIKGMVEGLDYRRFYPARSLDMLLGKDPMAEIAGFGESW